MLNKGTAILTFKINHRVRKSLSLVNFCLQLTTLQQTREFDQEFEPWTWYL